MKQISWTSAIALAAVAASPALAWNAASPEEQPLPPAGVAEIVVTAQKRSEKLQDVPIAMSVFTSDALRERAISEISQLSSSSPNVSLDAGTPFSGSSAVLAAYIRGIGANDFAINLDPGVGIYVDGVYLARTVGANLDLPDVARIEILKGPQGTLFGRNTIGGAISVVTRDPKDSFAFTGDVTTGRYHRLDIRGSVDVPISDQLAGMLTFSRKARDGYQKRIVFPGAGGYQIDSDRQFLNAGYSARDASGDQNEWTLRGKLLWTPASRLTMRLSGDYLRIDQAAQATSLLGVTSDSPGSFAGSTNIPGTALDPSGSTGFNFGGLYNFCIGATPAEIAARSAQNLCGTRGTTLPSSSVLPGLASVNSDSNPANDRLPFDQRWVNRDKDTSYATGINFSRLTAWSLTNVLDYELFDSVQMKSITGYRNLAWRSGTDLDNAPINAVENSFAIKQWQFSQELQLLGHAFDKTLNYVIGGYFFKEKASNDDIVTLGEGLLQANGPNRLSTKNVAAFGQVDWRISDLLGVTAGARYTHESKRLVGGIGDTNGFTYKLFNCMIYGDPCSSALGFPTAAEPLRYFVPGQQKQTFDNFSPKIGVQLHPRRDILVYGSWSRGYKTGGWTLRLTSPRLDAPKFGPEKAETFEIGVKSSLFDRRLQFNLAAFTTRYEDIQLTFIQISPIIQNAGNARIKGLEAEAVLAPMAGLTLTGALGYTRARYTSVAPAAQVAPNPLQAGVLEGAALPKTPRWKASISPRYETMLGRHGSLILLADYSWTASQWNDTERTYLIRRGATNLLNASLTYQAPDDRWNLTFGGTNLTNERYLVSGIASLGSAAIFGTWSRPAEWYARVGVRF